MTPGNDPAIDSMSPGRRLTPIVIVAERMVTLLASVMETSTSATGLAGPPLVNVAT